ncbi:MAG: ABC transporter substrate-binding protein [Treponema sp.]|jgi:NitT/TauT family transport system substrate-binding protein|nr:ABC transporter substrate-binding protein [Treponema sp.]
MKNGTKKAMLVLFTLILAGGALAQERVSIYGVRGPSGLGMIRLLERPPRAPGVSLAVELLAQADLVAARFISGGAKMGMLPPNVAAKIASSGKRIQVAAVTGTGMLSLLSSDPSVRGIGDLAGKTLEMAGQGATPDYVMRKILLAKGINPDTDLRLGYSLSYPEIARLLVLGRISLALLPEPFATMAREGRPDLAVIGDIQGEWAALHGGPGRAYPMTVFVVDADFAAARPLLVRAVLAALEESAAWVKANPEAAGLLAEKYGLGVSARVAAVAIPRSAYVFIPARKARGDLEGLFRAFLELSPASIGGSLPPDDFYFSRVP